MFASHWRMKILKKLFAILLLLCSLELVAVTFESKKAFRSVANDHYNVCFDGGKNFTRANNVSGFA